MQTAYIGLGSNLAVPLDQLRSALRAIAAVPSTRVVRHSRFYRTAPWGKSDQPEFINAVAEIETGLSARDLLDRLLAIERGAGRERTAERWGPRVLDLDILLYGREIIDEPSLHVPHPHMRDRAFVIIPLADVAPHLQIPGMGPIGDMLTRIDASTCIPLESGVLATE
jgi:2-amino-4-hydroxy-6-hydroxymethyldihydropteridine diphosphokinase